jgi:hypothetical protein
MTHAHAAVGRNIRIVADATDKGEIMLELDQIKQALPGLKANLKEAGESL